MGRITGIRDERWAGERARGDMRAMPVTDTAQVRGEMGPVGGTVPETPFDGDGDEDEDPDPGQGEAQGDGQGEGQGEGTHPADLDYEDREAAEGAGDLNGNPTPATSAATATASATPPGAKPKGKPGRPKKPEPEPRAPGEQKTPLPTSWKFVSGDPPGRRPSDAFRWLGALPDWAKDRIIIYGYRRWPVIDTSAVAGVSPDRTGRGNGNGETAGDGTGPNTTSIFKLSGRDGIQSVDEILRRWGSGDYTIRINDQVQAKKTIAYVVLNGLRDPDHPPVIENLNWIIKDDPANKSFINTLRARGIRLPWEEQVDTEVEDMVAIAEAQAAGQATKTLVDALVDVTRGNLKRMEEMEAHRPAASAEGANSPRAYAERTGVDLMADTTRKVIETMAQAQNPLGNIAEVIRIVKDLTPATMPAPAADTGAVDKLMVVVDRLMAANTEKDGKIHEIQLAMARERTESLERQLHELTNRVFGGGTIMNPAGQAMATQLGGQYIPTQMPHGGDPLRSRIEEYKEMKAIFSGDDGDDEGDGNGAAGKGKGQGAGDGGKSWTDYIPMVLNVGMMAMGMWASSMHNAAVARTGQGVPVAPPNPAEAMGMGMGAAMGQGQGAGAGGDNESDHGGPRPAHAGMGMGMPQGVGDQANGNGNAQGQETGMLQYMALMGRITEPMIAHLGDPNKDGVDFAEWLISSEQNGLLKYRQLREKVDTDTLYTLLMSYPPLANRIQGMESSVKRFLTEFLTYEEAIAAESEVIEPDDLPAAPVATSTQGQGQGQGDGVTAKPRRRVVS